MSGDLNDRSECEKSEFHELIAAARSGSDEAIGQLIQNFRPYLLMIANQELDPGVRGKVGASDVVQESLLTAQEGIRNFEGESEQDLKAWLRQILINDLRDTRRRFMAEKRNVDREIPIRTDSRILDVVNTQFTPQTRTQVDEEMEIVRRAMEKLPDDYREVIRLRNWQQMSFDQISKSMGRSPEAVRKLWSRAIDQLQTGLENGWSDDSSSPNPF